MNIFLDTSVLVKFFHEETGTDLVTEWLNNTSNTIWFLDLAKLEFISALHRRFRNKEINEPELSTALEAFDEQISCFNIEPIGQSVINEALLLLQQHGKTKGLRTLDALHLAAFLLISEKNWFFAAADRNLCATAKACGCKVLNPLETS